MQLRNLVGAVVTGRRVELQCCWIKVLVGGHSVLELLVRVCILPFRVGGLRDARTRGELRVPCRSIHFLGQATKMIRTRVMSHYGPNLLWTVHLGMDRMPPRRERSAGVALGSGDVGTGRPSRVLASSWRQPRRTPRAAGRCRQPGARRSAGPACAAWRGRRAGARRSAAALAG